MCKNGRNFIRTSNLKPQGDETAGLGVPKMVTRWLWMGDSEMQKAENLCCHMTNCMLLC